MADPFLAEIRIFPFNFAPKGWAFCDGQLMPLSQNTALFALVGTVYGGDGKSTFALPDLQGRAPMHPEQGPGLSYRMLGENGGSDSVTLLESEIPAHSHQVLASPGPGDRTSPAGNSIARTIGAAPYVPASPAPQTVSMAPETIAPSGGDLPHNNLQPYLTFNFCIALQGIFPARP